LARSIAVLMMLEGHCTGRALDPQYRDFDSTIYSVWFFIHNITSPLFFTVSGIIFVYLLLGKSDGSFLKNERVTKGLKRAAELVIWGYLLQVDVQAIYRGVSGIEEYDWEWIQAFHVLQSIGVGILVLIGVFALYKKWSKIPLHVYYFSVASLFFSFPSELAYHIYMHPGQHVPQGAPQWVQNFFYGPFSDFSFIRYLPFVLIGGAIGALYKKNEHRIFDWFFIARFVVMGLILVLFSERLMWLLDQVMYHGLDSKRAIWAANAIPLQAIGVVLLFLSLLMILDGRGWVKNSLFVRVGQNTFVIYVAHVIFLYGGIFGVGLSTTVLLNQFNPWETAAISTSFILFFVLFVWFIEKLPARWRRSWIFG
jgi:Heparan-alpha-glucosaminide N-acetyltransferase, catalytic